MAFVFTHKKRYDLIVPTDGSIQKKVTCLTARKKTLAIYYATFFGLHLGMRF